MTDKTVLTHEGDLIEVRAEHWGDGGCPETELHIKDTRIGIGQIDKAPWAIHTQGSMAWQALRIGHSPAAVKEFGWLRYLWGRDLFLGPVPFCKTVVLVNLIVWYLLR